MSHLPALRRSHPGHYKPWLSRVASCRSCLARSLLGQVASPVVLFPSRRELPRAGQGDPVSADDTAPPSLPSWYGQSRAVFIRGITCLPQGNGPRIYVPKNKTKRRKAHTVDSARQEEETIFCCWGGGGAHNFAYGQVRSFFSP